MFRGNKRGQMKGQAIISNVIMGLLIFFIFIIGIVALLNRDKGTDAIKYSIETVSGQIMNILSPFLTFILGLGNDTNTNFLMVLTFILILIIIVGIFESVNIFGDDPRSKWTNFAVGVIVSIIGVRFMPADMWTSLTAPSSAFVATILVGIPFGAFFFISMKVSSTLARKLLWLFYLIFMSYLIFVNGSTGFSIVYVIFLILGTIMMFFDATVRHFYYQEMHKKDIEDTIGQMNAQQRYSLRRQIERWDKIIGDPTAPPKDKALAKANLAKARKTYGDISSI